MLLFGIRALGVILFLSLAACAGAPPNPISPDLGPVFVEAFLVHHLKGGWNQPQVSCLETCRASQESCDDASPRLLSQLADEGIKAVPASECTVAPFEEAEAGNGWLHVPTGGPAELFRVRVTVTDVSSADFVLFETFSTHAQVCHYRAVRVRAHWEFTLVDPRCAVGDRFG